MITTLSAATTSGGSFSYRVTADSAAVRYFYTDRASNGEGEVRLKQTISGLSPTVYTLTIQAGPLTCDASQVCCT